VLATVIFEVDGPVLTRVALDRIRAADQSEAAIASSS
jgi:hypothetical protein